MDDTAREALHAELDMLPEDLREHVLPVVLELIALLEAQKANRLSEVLDWLRLQDERDAFRKTPVDRFGGVTRETIQKATTALETGQVIEVLAWVRKQRDRSDEPDGG